MVRGHGLGDLSTICVAPNALQPPSARACRPGHTQGREPLSPALATTSPANLLPERDRECYALAALSARHTRAFAHI